MQKLNKVLTGRFLKFLEEEAKNDADKYVGFFKEFGHFLKEGVVSDFTHREALAKLLRYETSQSRIAGWHRGLRRADARGAEGDLLHLRRRIERPAWRVLTTKALKVKNYEALFLFDPWDEFVMEHLREFEGKKLAPAERAEIALEAGEKKLDDTAARLLCNFIKESLGDKIGEVRVSSRLVDSPAVVVESDKGMTSSMRRILKNLESGDGKSLQARFGNQPQSSDDGWPRRLPQNKPGSRQTSCRADL